MIDVRSAALPRAALEKAVTFLIERQSGDGAWRDFQLKPGRSDAWVTAYVGLRLLRAETCAPDAEMRPALAAATRYLEGARHRDGGWGYNGKSPPDADSTAQSILFLRAGFGAVTLADYAALARFQLRDGAFATYRRGDGRDGWCRGHPDVTAVALRAMAGMLRPDHVRLRRGYARLAGYLARKNALASYWWPSPFYLAREVLVLACDAGAPPLAVPRLEMPPNGSSFEQALACDVAFRRESPRPAADSALRQLCSQQLNDGSWPSTPILRVVNPRSKRLYDRAFCRSPVVCDDRRMFTTATVVSALVSARSHAQQP